MRLGGAEGVAHSESLRDVMQWDRQQGLMAAYGPDLTVFKPLLPLRGELFGDKAPPTTQHIPPHQQ